MDIEQDLSFQHREWRRERIGWVVIGLILLAGLLGLFGHHPFARATSQTAKGQLTVEYDRFARYESTAELMVTVKPQGKGEGKTSLWFDADYLDSINVVAVSPTPVRGEASAAERAFVFQTEGKPFSAIFSIQFRTIGLVHGRVRVNDQEALSLTHMVWP
jgi:hypothetical protein